MTASIDLLRHGEPVGGPRYRGRTDDPLSGRGWLQMHRAVSALGPWQRIDSSPLRRCRDFAERLARHQGLPLQVDTQMTEIDFGRWEGLTAAQLMRHDAEALGNFWRDPVSHTPHGGETLTDFRDRIIDAWQRLLHGLPQDGRLLLVSHGGAIRILLHHILGIPLLKLQQIEVPYGCLSRIHVDWYDGKPSARLAAHGSLLP
ncbi:Alpha-ribazole-5'-phosphate phosphatase [hydrothermal vent metagenome]|uniref:Alpha-ribazole-5'-phosphate phosphatase n=1 Tax=hydrothermal vent metagenome TaxID=652676 RepID=A0A3B1BCC8_9ZZZZ